MIRVFITCDGCGREIERSAGAIMRRHLEPSDWLVLRPAGWHQSWPAAPLVAAAPLAGLVRCGACVVADGHRARKALRAAQSRGADAPEARLEYNALRTAWKADRCSAWGPRPGASRSEAIRALIARHYAEGPRG